jgi:hypothetical protein
MTALTTHLIATVTVADPDVVGPLAVFPLIATQARSLRYRAFAQGGVTVHELEEASVNDLLVNNALDVPVLLYEGEEVLGAQQNRTFDVSVLVPAGTELQVPVSCVEAQRWDGGRHGEAFTPAPQTAYPELRRAKSERMRGRLAAGEEARADQGAVWSMVAAKAQRHGVASPTGALHDVFDGRRDELAALSGRIVARPDQVGMLAAIAGRFIEVNDGVECAALANPLVDRSADCFATLGERTRAAEGSDRATDHLDAARVGEIDHLPVGANEVVGSEGRVRLRRRRRRRSGVLPRRA